MYAYCSFLISIQRKCEQYWNDQLDKPYNARGSFTVVTTGCRSFADYVVRDLTLRRVSTLGTQAIHAMHIIPVKCTIHVHMYACPLLCFSILAALRQTPLCEAFPIHWMARPRNPPSAILPAQVHQESQDGMCGHWCTHCSPLQVREGSYICEQE